MLLFGYDSCSSYPVASPLVCSPRPITGLCWLPSCHTAVSKPSPDIAQHKTTTNMQRHSKTTKELRQRPSARKALEHGCGPSSRALFCGVTKAGSASSSAENGAAIFTTRRGHLDVQLGAATTRTKHGSVTNAIVQPETLASIF